MTVLRAVTVPIEIAHRGLDGMMHGHSLTAEVWTAAEVDLDQWHVTVRAVTSRMEGQLEATIGARTFEGVGAAILGSLPEACRVVVRLPTRGHCVDVRR